MFPISTMKKGIPSHLKSYDNPSVIPRLTKAAEAISGMGERLPGTFQVLAMTLPLVVARHNSAEAISVG